MGPTAKQGGASAPRAPQYSHRWHQFAPGDAKANISLLTDRIMY